MTARKLTAKSEALRPLLYCLHNYFSSPTFRDCFLLFYVFSDSLLYSYLYFRIIVLYSSPYFNHLWNEVQSNSPHKNKGHTHHSFIMYESYIVDAVPAWHRNHSFGVNLVRWSKKTRWHRKPLSMQRSSSRGECKDLRPFLN